MKVAWVSLLIIIISDDDKYKILLTNSSLFEFQYIHVYCVSGAPVVFNGKNPKNSILIAKTPRYTRLYFCIVIKNSKKWIEIRLFSFLFYFFPFDSILSIFILIDWVIVVAVIKCEWSLFHGCQARLLLIIIIISRSYGKLLFSINICHWI